MKKFFVLMLCVVISLMGGSSAFAAALSADDVAALPPGYAEVADGDIEFGTTATAYSPVSLDKIITAYGGNFTYTEDLPPEFASKKGGDISFDDSAIAYSPISLDKIIRAYGGTLSPDKVEAGGLPAGYAEMKGGEIAFGDTATAYSPASLNAILSAYDFGVRVREAGPSKPGDSDGDGVPDNLDECPNTPRGVEVDSRGCPLDSDGDGVPDYLDQCPNTPRGVEVDSRGCPVTTTETRMDSDGDGVYDDMDACPDTPRGVVVNERGCWIVENLLFDFDKAVIKPQYYSDLDEVVRVLKENPEMTVQIQGHTDSIGSHAYNMGLSKRRAKAVVDYLTSRGIEPYRLSYQGFGETQPVAPNKYPDGTDNPEGRAKNRRVEIHPQR